MPCTFVATYCCGATYEYGIPIRAARWNTTSAPRHERRAPRPRPRRCRGRPRPPRGRPPAEPVEVPPPRARGVPDERPHARPPAIERLDEVAADEPAGAGHHDALAAIEAFAHGRVRGLCGFARQARTEAARPFAPGGAVPRAGRAGARHARAAPPRSGPRGSLADGVAGITRSGSGRWACCPPPPACRARGERRAPACSRTPAGPCSPPWAPRTCPSCSSPTWA